MKLCPDTLDEAIRVAALYGQGKQGIATSAAIQRALRKLKAEQE